MAKALCPGSGHHCPSVRSCRTLSIKLKAQQCSKCLKPGHSVRDCSAGKQCTVDGGCDRHSFLLHCWRANALMPHDLLPRTSSFGVLPHHFGIILVSVHGAILRSVRSHTLLDNGFSRLIEEKGFVQAFSLDSLSTTFTIFTLTARRMKVSGHEIHALSSI